MGAHPGKGHLADIVFMNPVFKAHLRVEVIPTEGVLLLSEETAIALHGRLYERLVPLLDGANSTQDIVAALTPEFGGAHVYYALARLQKNGYLTEAAPTVAPAQAAFWDGIGLSSGVAQQNLLQKGVSLHAVGSVSVTPLREALSRLGIRISNGRGDLAIVLTDDYQRAELVDINALMRANEQAWLLARPAGHESWLGPLYTPDGATCHGCLVRRLERHRIVPRFIAQRKAHPRNRRLKRIGI